MFVQSRNRNNSSLPLVSRLLFSLNDICALNESLNNSSEENILKVLLYGEEDLLPR